MKDEIKEILEDIKKVLTSGKRHCDNNEILYDEMNFEIFKWEMLLDYITNLQEEVEDLRESDWAWHQTLKAQNKREYRSKFLKEFQEEYGTNTFPDYDEIYKRYDEIKKENERLKNGYCELKVKCNNGECDCTNEEYEDMAQANMRGSLLLEDYKSRCEKASKLIRFIAFNSERPLTITELNKVYNILQGVGKDE